MQAIHQNIEIPNSGISLVIKREDLLHPFISGNKYRKLKYNFVEVKNQKCKKLITFGGAFSNHIAATAYACKQEGIEAIGIIRGEEVSNKMDDNPTLRFAKEMGMQFKFVSREAYQNKDSEFFLNHLTETFGPAYILPEGGTNALAIKGCEEILNEEDASFDFICCAVGTGGTISGIINSLLPHQKAIGFPAIKGFFLENEIIKFAKKEQWTLNNEYHFGGYAKVNEDLIGFINWFYTTYKIPLDPVYTGKMLYGVFDLVTKKYFPSGTKILVIHTGGLQGNAGMNLLLEKKKQTKLLYY